MDRAPGHYAFWLHSRTKKKFNTSVNHSYELKMQPTFRIFTKTSPDP